MPPTGHRTPYQVAAREGLRRGLLETARELLRGRHWTSITMAEVAGGAGVSRQTLYNEFGSRTGFVQAYVLYDADRILTAVDDAIEAAGNEPRRTIEQAFQVFLDMISEDPLAITVLAGDDPDGLLSLVTTRGGPVLAIAAQRLGAAIQRNWPQAATKDVDLLATQLVRLALSHAMLPIGESAAVASQIADLLTPFAQVALLQATVEAP